MKGSGDICIDLSPGQKSKFSAGRSRYTVYTTVYIYTSRLDQSSKVYTTVQVLLDKEFVVQLYVTVHVLLEGLELQVYTTVQVLLDEEFVVQLYVTVHVLLEGLELQLYTTVM